MNKIQKLARKIAAVDESLLENCPQADRNWANHIGYALALTFIVVFGLVFYSLLTIDGAKVVYDVQTNAIKMDSSSHEMWNYLVFAGVAGVIALIIFLFDRAFYQSDWFSHHPYGQKMSMWKKIKTFFSKISRMSVRIGISLILAYALSTFAELKFYESELLTSMQKQHLEENKDIYTRLKADIQSLEDEIPEKKQEEMKLLKKLQNIENGVVSIADEPVMQRLEASIAKIDVEQEKTLQRVSKEYHKDIDQIQEILNPLDVELKKLTEEYNEEETYYHAEVNGIKEITVAGKVIKASGRASEGKRAKMHKASMKQIQREIAKVESQRDLLLERMQKREKEYNQSKTKIEKRFKEKVAKLESQKRDYYKQMVQTLRSSANDMKIKYGMQLKRVQDRLNELMLHKDEMIQKMYQKMMQSPEFISFRDGPMSRIMALKRLENDPQYGEDVALVSWVVRGFIIFLEAIPILSKMWFGPQTLYATLLQMRLKRMTQEAIDNEGITFSDIEKSIEYEKKKQELHDAKLQTWHKEVFNEEYKQNINQEMHRAMQEFEMRTNKKNNGETV